MKYIIIVSLFLASCNMQSGQSSKEMKREINLLEGFNAVKVEVICRESGLPIVISESKIIDIFTHVENEAVKFMPKYNIVFFDNAGSKIVFGIDASGSFVKDSMAASYKLNESLLLSCP